MAKEFKLAKAKADELLASKSEEKAFTYDEQDRVCMEQEGALR